MTSRALAAAYLVLLSTWTAHAADPGFAPYARDHPFVESMQLMVDAMGLNKAGPGGGSPYGSTWWPSSPGFSYSPWSHPLTSMMPGGTQQGMQQLMRGMGSQAWMPQYGGQSAQGGGFPQWPLGATGYPQLEGIWQGRAGEVLEIRGGYFRLYATTTRHIEGSLQVEGSILTLNNQQQNTSSRYEFAVHEDRLALRDPRGQLLLFRRKEPRPTLPGVWSR